METEGEQGLGRASWAVEEFPYLLRKLEYWGTTFNNASLTTKAAQLRYPSFGWNVRSLYVHKDIS